VTTPAETELRRRLGRLRATVARTSRLALTLPDPARTPEVVRLIGERRIARWTLTIPYPYTERDAREWLRRARRGRRLGTHLALQVVRAADGILLGGVGLHHLDALNRRAELGYWIGRPFRRQGYGAEAAAGATAFAFRRLGLLRVEARITPGNVASAGVLRAVGYRREGRLRGSILKDGAARDEIVFGRLASDGPLGRARAFRFTGSRSAPRSRPRRRSRTSR
jgi:[ribosomal protein S5]-alanine N-acetyltransferase